ncbi:phytoene desaturase [Rosenbergiella epipactidis]|uniref:phytoene desaturase n=1 Tax=Rosenbergiella epipactidis TaxID=1544694 RepID=UPI0006644FEF|nr:phytoene desaturase [Rosenbergiella epipactidis]KMV69352.1 phytoene dehydrogenase [bacteria symbiont BFo2 of Frankliniella occidentalis]KYP94051.1 phytoene dehydrogenase [bacteria symbiont BFo2 of Frankliniella occidentalis]KYP94101.1 phytoene dehydrogenase [bacteria symbiont BFo2 of Frankliniella occidentalis]
MKKTVVIGAGFGGLALAIRLQAAGIPTLLLEQRDKPGGRAYVYQEQGFTFDAGPTVITDPTALFELFELAGKRIEDYVELLPVKPFYRLCWENGKVFDYDNDQAELDRQILAFNPADVQGYQRFLAYSQAVFKEGYLKLGTVPFLSFKDMLRAAPQLGRLQAWRSVYSKVASYIQDEHLRQAFSFHSLLVGGNPFATSSIYTLIHALEREWGVWFPLGGTGALVQGLVKLFQDLGGELLLNAKVDQIACAQQRITQVTLEDGREFSVAAIASNADVVNTYRHLLREHQPSTEYAEQLVKKRMSNSLFVLYFGLNHHHDQLAHHTVCFGPRYRELIDEIFHHDGLAEDFSLYLHAPCVTDPSLAPEGCGSYYVLAPVPHLGTAALDWEVEGPKLRDKIFAYLEAHYMPGLRSQLVVHRMFTPFDFRDQLQAFQGSAFSIEPILTQSAWFRPHNRDKTLENLYLVGAGTHPGAGVPGVLGSAKATAGLMIEDNHG